MAGSKPLVIFIFKKNNYNQLRFLWPDLQFYTEDAPAFGKRVFVESEFLYNRIKNLLNRADLILVQSVSGYNVDTQNGLSMLLEASGYLTGSKLERFRKKTDWPSKEIVYAMYKSANMLAIANKLPSFDESEPFILDLLEMPYEQRLVLIEDIGYEVVISRILTMLTKFFDKSKVSYKEFTMARIARVLAAFNKDTFKKTYSLTGDPYTDCVILLGYFR